jgi:hypothetical protein
VLGTDDEAFSRQAEQLGALYLIASDLDEIGLQSAMRQAMEHRTPMEEPAQWYYGMVVRPVAVDASATTTQELRSAGSSRGVVVH